MPYPMPGLRRALLLALTCVTVTACAAPPRTVGVPTATPDIPLLETRTEQELSARLTAMAPMPTATPVVTAAPPTPTRAPLPTRTPTPSVSVAAPSLVHVRRDAAEDPSNIVVPAWADGDEVLTHFTDPVGIYALTWSQDGSTLAFIATHNFGQSRDDERNIFTMRADGTGLTMVTGDYLAPDEALGPYVTISGRVEGAQGPCRVTAKGLGTSVETDAESRYLLEGVSQTANWVRAVCPSEAGTYQGSAELTPGAVEVAIPVALRGQGWRDISLAPDGQRYVATRYRWRQENGEIIYDVEGVIRDVEGNEYAILPLPEGMRFHGASWSPDGQRIVGGISDEESTYLWLWDANGVSIDGLYKMDNPEDQFLSFERPVWSPDGATVATELHVWYWWSGERFRTDLVRVSADGQTIAGVIQSDWGGHATHISWGSDGKSLFYQYHTSDTDTGDLIPASANIRSVPLDNPVATEWTTDGTSYLPAVRPVRHEVG